MENQQDNHPLYAAINRELAAALAATPIPPAWSDLWLRLGPHSTEEDRLAVYRAIRDSGVLPAEAGFFLVAWQTDALVLRDADEALRTMRNGWRPFGRQYGVGRGRAVARGAGAAGVRRGACNHFTTPGMCSTPPGSTTGRGRRWRGCSARTASIRAAVRVGRAFFHGPP